MKRRIKEYSTMKTAVWAGMLVGVAFGLQAQDSEPDTSGLTVTPGITITLTNPPVSNIFSNSPPQPTAPLPTPPPDDSGPPAIPALTNGVLLPLPIPVKKEIRPVPGGGVGDYGFVVVEFPADVCDAPTIVHTPDQKTLTFRPTYLVVENRRTGETYLLGTVTNSLGIISGSEVLYTNAFDLVNADVKYSYSGTSLEQFIILRENVSTSFPSNWLTEDPDNLSIECWTEWFDSEPLAVQPQITALRSAGVKDSAVMAQDEKSDFGYLKLTAGGRAFSIGDEGNSVPVAKTWADAEPDASTALDLIQQPVINRRFLIESVDFEAVRPNLSQLVGGKQHASLGNRKSNHSILARNAASWRPRGAQDPKPLLVTKNSRSPGQGLEVDFSLVGCYPVPTGGISWWMGQTNAFDSIGTNNGTAYNGVTYVMGKALQAFNLYGPYSQHIRITNSVSLSPTNALTIEAWVNPNSLGSWQNIVSKWDAVWQDPPQRSYLIGLYPDGHVYFGYSSNANDSGSASAISASTLPVNQWTHVAGTFDGNYIRIFVNGTNETSVYFPYKIYPGNNDLAIGGCVGGLSAGQDAYTFTGQIDEVTLYNRGLTTNEIQGIYAAGAAAKCGGCSCVTIPTNYRHWWTADGTPSDLTGTNNAILAGGVTYSPAAVGPGLTFDGTTGLGKVPASPALDIGNGNAMTVEAWVKPQTNAVASLVEWSSSTNTGFHLQANYPWVGYFWVNLVDTNNVSHYTYAPGLINNAFNHVAVTYNRAGGMAVLYVNGTPTTYYPGTFTPKTGVDLYLGYRLVGGSVYLNGQLDEVTLYNRDLSSSEIASIFIAGICGKCKVDSDGDNLPDLWATTYFGGLNQTAGGDYDSDGLTNLQEYQLGTRPNNSDSDGDGVSDSTEILMGRSPLIPGTVSDTNWVIQLQAFTPFK